MHREPDVGFDPGSPGSRPGPKAGAKPLSHPDIPMKKLLFDKPKSVFLDAVCCDIRNLKHMALIPRCGGRKKQGGT